MGILSKVVLPLKRMDKKLLQLEHVIGFYAFLLVLWGFYRALFKLPDAVEEAVLKPLVWLIPTIWLVRREGLGLASLGWTFKNLWKSIYIAIGLGVLFAAVAVLANLVKYNGSPNFSLPPGVPGTAPLFFGALGLSLVTAISEETVFRGFIFNRLWRILKNELFANVVTTLGWAIIHIPVLIFVYKLGLSEISVRAILTAAFGFGSAFVFARTGNIAPSILLHLFWGWTITLFR
ncbi:MAG: CPBP family intramembrane metalloprotease [Candidatus Blackburnbacteria bacterium]|nr:CPBP family intramembrane metalloprotease [Candidatus Blackburnbacteria bacterium]